MKRTITIVVVVLMTLALMLGAVGCSTPKEAAPEPAEEVLADESTAVAEDEPAEEPAEDAAEGDGGYLIGKISYTLSHAYQVSDAKFFEQYVLEDGNDVIVLDGKADGETMMDQVEDLINKNVDGVVLQPADEGVANNLVKTLHDAGIPAVTFVNNPEDVDAPHVVLDEYPAAFEMGQICATKWQEWFSDEPILVGIFDLPNVKQVHEDRAMGFMDGVLDVDPDAELVSILDGGGETEKSYAAAQDMLQANPEINMVFGINASSCLGALAAFEEVGRGTATDGIPDTELFASCDGTELEGMKIYNPSSSLKITMGLVPSTFAKTQYDTLMSVISGDIDMNEEYLVNVTDGLFDYWTSTVDDFEAWLMEEYGVEEGYADEVRKSFGE